MYAVPAQMNTTSTAALIATSTVFVFADSLIPRTSRAATTKTIAIAGRLNGGAGQHEDARADDRPDAERRQIPRPQRSPEHAAIGLLFQLGNRFLGEQARARGGVRHQSYHGAGPWPVSWMDGMKWDGLSASA